jgi:chromosome segregation ATPase
MTVASATQKRGEQMSTDNLIIEHLRAIRTEIASVKSDTTDTRQRVGSVETSIIDMRRNVVHLFEDMAHQQLTMDKLLDRVQRIEKRLDLC